MHLTQYMNLNQLQELNLDSCSVGDTSLSYLADNNVMPNLLSLDLSDTHITDIFMSKIIKFPKLKNLSLFYCNITNNSLKYISKLLDLEVLNIDNRDITDDGLHHLQNLKNLHTLDIFSGRITDIGCTFIAKIISLQSLELCGGCITDLGCELLSANLENLIHLNLSQNEHITNRGSAALATLYNLKTLNLSSTSVTASGIRFFSGLRQLQSLSLYDCRGIIDDEKYIINLQNCLPNLKCLRSERTSNLDGMIVVCDDDDDDDEEADDDNSFLHTDKTEIVNHHGNTWGNSVVAD